MHAEVIVLIEETLVEDFLPMVLKFPQEEVVKHQDLFILPVWFGGTGVKDLTKTEEDVHRILVDITNTLSKALQLGMEVFGVMEYVLATCWRK